MEILRLNRQMNNAANTSPADGDLVAIRKPGEVARRYSYRRAGEGAGIELDAGALTREARPLPKGEV
jgi:hypothetical protein